MNIACLEKKLTDAEILLNSKESELLSFPDNFALSLSINSLKLHITDLQFQLKTLKEQREKEVIELRLKGGEVNSGSVPLETLANLTKYFSGLITSAAAKIKLGHDVSKGIPENISHPLNLRFADIKLGSSKLYITGDNSPDLFGESLLENSLSGLFELLNKDINDGLIDQVHYIGLKSAHNLAEFLKSLRKKNIEIDITWQDSSNNKHFWHGRRDKIQILETLLNSFSSSEPINVTLSGVIELISRSGKIEIKGTEGETIKITYPRKLFSDVKKLRLGDHVILDVQEMTVYNSSTEEQKKKYTLINIISTS